MNADGRVDSDRSPAATTRFRPAPDRSGMHVSRRLLVGLAMVLPVLLVFPSPNADGAVRGAFSIRGVVAGSFGPVWSHTARLDMIRWMAAHGMNTFLWGPFEEQSAAYRWRDDFSDDAMADLAQEIAVARSLGVDWGFQIRPGLKLFPDSPEQSRDICFSCRSDFELVAAKFDRFHRLGVRLFAVDFHDTVKASSHPEDAAAYGVGDASYGRMNADLANRLHARFPDSVLIFGPSDYSGTARTDYLTAVGETLDDDVVIGWLGPTIFPQRITATEADAFADAVARPGGPRRRIIIWDNYPSNDLYGEAYSAEVQGARVRPLKDVVLHLGPLKGRGADLVGHVEGVLSNSMHQPHASKLALFTIAAYLSTPSAYTSDSVQCRFNPSERTRAGCLAEEAWLNGIREYGGAAATPLLDVVNQMRATPFDRTESPVFVARRDAFASAFTTARWKPSWGALIAELTAERDGGRRLRDSQLPSQEFVTELAHHLETLELNTRSGILAADMLAAQRPSLASLSACRTGTSSPWTLTVSGVAQAADPAAVAATAGRLAPVEAAMRTSPFVVHGARAYTDLNGLWVGENRMDQFLDWAHATTTAWLPLAPLAASGPLSVHVEGVNAPLDRDGKFSVSVTVPTGQRAATVVVADAAGFQTAEKVADCLT